ncbi:hypothetical protein SAMN02745911_3795 [Aureimonas altamirensis DSM 21988]|uniref:Uncharacterized protein n=1 Tax=Aureimonas altamirensis DSM 21988 TaxID=1121026 RepID=A0ABY1IR86_9HYPH|nr:hypothetical protein [Aureimonas altamirensis]SHJ95136.1 hypothetical protein SAMN02745911_3795 [Aureimonas altamirensis DSM 21988]
MQRNVRAGTVDVEARTLTAIVATNATRIMDIRDGDLDAWITVEELVLIEGMNFDRVASGMQFRAAYHRSDRGCYPQPTATPEIISGQIHY